MVQYKYDAWGNHKVLDANGNEISEDYTNEYGFKHIGHRNPFRYRGYFYDVNTKLYYLESRFYDPETGRFINHFLTGAASDCLDTFIDFIVDSIT